MIKLLLAIPTLDHSGAEKQFTLLATHLPREEFDIQAVALTRGGPFEKTLKDHQIPLTVLRKRWKLDPFALYRYRQILKQFQPDIVHPWLFAANSYTRLLAGKRELPKVVISERCVDSWKSGWQLWLDRKQIPRTARLIANSQSVADFYRNLGYPPETIRVIPNAVQIPDHPGVTRSAILNEFDIPQDAMVIGYIGRLARQKRIKDLIWAMQLLKQLMMPVYFLIVGDGPERFAAAKLARHFGVDNLVRFAGHRDSAARYLCAMDVFWLGSDFEGMSNSLMEAMAAGVPVVASDIPPNRELIVNGETGFLVPVGDCPGFAQFAHRLLSDETLRTRIREAALRKMRTEHSVEKMVQAHVELYREVLQLRGET